MGTVGGALLSRVGVAHGWSGLVLVYLGSSSLAAAALAAFPAAALAGNWSGPSADVLHSRTFTIAADKVTGAQQVRFDDTWRADLKSGNQAVTDATVAVRSGYPAADFSGITSFPDIQTWADLATGQDVAIDLPSSLTSNAVTGFDSSRSVTPPAVPVGGGRQTLSVTFDALNSTSDVLGIDVPADVPGEAVSCGATTAPTSSPYSARCSSQNNVAVWQTCIAGSGCLPLNRSATFTFVLDEPNASSQPLLHDPQVRVTDYSLGTIYTVSGPNTGNVGSSDCGTTVPYTTSLTVPDPSLDGTRPGSGSVTLSSGASGRTYCWQAGVHDAYAVAYMTSPPPSASPSPLATPVAVATPVPNPPPQAAGAVKPAPSHGGAPGSSSAGPGAPVNAAQSIFASALLPPASTLTSAAAVVVNAAVTIAVLGLVTFPSLLFNRTYEENHAVIRAWWERRVRWIARVRRRLQRVAAGRRGAISFAIVLVVGSALGALLDSGFGGNLRTLVLFAGIACSVVASMLVGGLVNLTYRRARHRDVRWALQALPSGLVVAGGCVLLSRLTGFQPGYLYGLIGGIAFAGKLTDREEAHVVALTSLITLAISVGAWLLWVPVSAAASQPGASVVLALLENFLAATFIGGLIGMVIGLTPLRFLPGRKLVAWRRGAWCALYGLAAFGVVQVLLRPQITAFRAAAPFWMTMGFFLGFAALSVVFWSYFSLRGRRLAIQPAAPD